MAAKHAGVASLGRLGAWLLALGDAAPEDHADAGGWTLERTLDALRSTSREALAARRGLETLLSDVDREADELRHRLSASAEFQVSRERVPDDPELTLVQVRHGGRSHPIAELDRWLEGELHVRERTIAEEDRRLFESFLVGGLADALRERIGSAGTLVASMNEALTDCTTSSGMRIELDWRPREHDDTGLREAVALLRRDVALLTDDARARLVEFLRRRIEDARQSLEQGSSTEHVMAALDYREWHEFRVIQLLDGRREVLTRRRHQQGSGGEKSVALHLPLFAAAAAQFAAAAETCPRMILLDEAFAGIDERMRAQLLGLLERFDLDFVLTSHELWGCYPELSALGIYHLHREPGIPGVATAHFRWDGRRRVEGSGSCMSPETITYLNKPGLRRMLFAARERFERNGGPYGRLQLTQLSPDEAHTLNGLLTPQRPFAPGGEAWIKLPRLDAQLRHSRFAISLEDALVAVGRAAGQPPSRARGHRRGPGRGLGARAPSPPVEPTGARRRGSSMPAAGTVPHRPNAPP